MQIPCWFENPILDPVDDSQDFPWIPPVMGTQYLARLWFILEYLITKYFFFIGSY